MKLRYQQIDKNVLVLRPQSRHHDGAYLARLAESLVRVQLQPIGVLKDYTVIWGNARVLAARSKPEITHLVAAVFDEPVTEREFQRMRFIENQLRQDLSNAEKCLNCVEYAKNEPTMNLKEIAGDLGVDPSMVTRWMAWEKCCALVQQALSCDSITLQTMYSLSQLPLDQQEAGLAKHVNPKKAERNGSSGATVKCRMPSGAVVTLKGDGMTLDTVIEVLGELLKAAKKANDEGLDAKTWERVLRDKAKA